MKNMKNIILKNAFIVDPSQKINGLGSIIIKDKIIIDLILNRILLLIKTTIMSLIVKDI